MRSYAYDVFVVWPIEAKTIELAAGQLRSGEVDKLGLATFAELTKTRMVRARVGPSTNHLIRYNLGGYLMLETLVEL